MFNLKACRLHVIPYRNVLDHFCRSIYPRYSFADWMQKGKIAPRVAINSSESDRYKWQYLAFLVWGRSKWNQIDLLYLFRQQDLEFFFISWWLRNNFKRASRGKDMVMKLQAREKSWMSKMERLCNFLLNWKSFSTQIWSHQLNASVLLPCSENHQFPIQKAKRSWIFAWKKTVLLLIPDWALHL